MVTVKQVCKQFGGKRVVDDVTVSMEKGKITSFIGPNGAGKSTLVGMMTRLLSKDGGEIFIDGVEIGRYKSDELARKLSILKQSNDLNIRLTVRELVSFGRFPHSKGRLTKEDEGMVSRAIDYMNLAPLEHQFIDKLSGGQRQRAFIAMVIAQDTDYIFLDEPLNNLDMKHSVGIMKVLRRLADELGKTIGIVIHDINFASCYSDTIVAMKEGRIVKEGPAANMMCSSTLRDIYDMDIRIERFGGHNIGVYYA